MFSGITDGISRQIEGAVASVSGVFFEPVLRLGVTGLSRAGKTVFITGLVANLLDRGRMPQLSAQAQGRIEAVYLQPQPDDTLPRFAYEDHLAALTGNDPRWPQSTRAVSELRLSFRVRPSGFFGSLAGPRVVHVDIVDYPGEWLLDLALLDKTYAEWSETTLDRIAKRAEAADFMATARAEDGSLRLDETKAQALAVSFTAYLTAARAAGWSDCTPGRFLLPGDLAGSPVLTFAPLPQPATAPRNSLWREMQRRYDAYKSRVVQPFFRDHFAKIDRQIVLVDVLGAIHQGPRAVEDLRRTMAEVLAAFRPGRNGWLSGLLGGKRVEKILFAATKADHLHSTSHDRLEAILNRLVANATRRARFAGAETRSLALAAIRATREGVIEEDGETLDVILGTPIKGETLEGTTYDGKSEIALFPGDLPASPESLFEAGEPVALNFLRFMPPQKLDRNA
ncbi:MAG: YcjX family protein, partial [Cypionkella sp.]|uniref:YcjX family protein n=1 Tax=Cypionkella sp. TaxID=2811411 RepID=UPI0027267138